MGTQKLVYNIRELAQLLNISKALCYELVKRAEIPGIVHLGVKRIVCSKFVIDRWLSGEDILNPAIRQNVEPSYEITR
jgi:predicted DNA-binding transcriptional regulator AlpA